MCSFTSGTSKGTSWLLFLRISASKRSVLSLGAKFSSCIFIQVASALRQSLVSSDKKKRCHNAHPLFGISGPTQNTYCRGGANSGTCHLCRTQTAWPSCPPCSEGAPSGEERFKQWYTLYWSIANQFLRENAGKHWPAGLRYIFLQTTADGSLVPLDQESAQGKENVWDLKLNNLRSQTHAHTHSVRCLNLHGLSFWRILYQQHPNGITLLQISLQAKFKISPAFLKPNLLSK